MYFAGLTEGAYSESRSLLILPPVAMVRNNSMNKIFA
jgi:hypothetical protein